MLFFYVAWLGQTAPIQIRDARQASSHALWSLPSGDTLYARDLSGLFSETVDWVGCECGHCSVVYGALLMLAFAIDRCIPLVVGGLTLIAVGLYFLNEYYFWI